MAIVSVEYRKTEEEITSILEDVSTITPELLLMIDFVNHNTDYSYDEGLSFLDRLHRKLSMYFDIEWNVQNLKTTIRNSETPSNTFVEILNEILTEEMIDVYGI